MALAKGEAVELWSMVRSVRCAVEGQDLAR
jgi:hypothetical protein